MFRSNRKSQRAHRVKHTGNWHCVVARVSNNNKNIYLEFLWTLSLHSEQYSCYLFQQVSCNIEYHGSGLTVWSACQIVMHFGSRPVLPCPATALHALWLRDTGVGLHCTCVWVCVGHGHWDLVLVCGYRPKSIFSATLQAHSHLDVIQEPL